MIVRLNPSALRDIRWYEYVVRFALGGAMTVIAGLIASRFGPVIGGLFLAFPAIFPASATLIEKHERERKEKAGLSGARRGKEAAALDSAGAVLGSLGLAAFAIVIWLLTGAIGVVGAYPGHGGMGCGCGVCMAGAAMALSETL
jgi:hypothetical protein